MLPLLDIIFLLPHLNLQIWYLFFYLIFLLYQYICLIIFIYQLASFTWPKWFVVLSGKNRKILIYIEDGCLCFFSYFILRAKEKLAYLGTVISHWIISSGSSLSYQSSYLISPPQCMWSASGILYTRLILEITVQLPEMISNFLLGLIWTQLKCALPYWKAEVWELIKWTTRSMSKYYTDILTFF